jgi:multisubunit Na+/H+ antiporter MnhB subunit
MFSQLLAGGAISFLNFAIHAVMTTLIVIATGRAANRTGHLHVFGRLTALLAITMLALMVAHVVEIVVWAACYNAMNLTTANATAFEFAFENYTALGYGDSVPNADLRLIGPITSLNGLLLIGWSVAIIFEVLRMAEVRFEKPRRKRTR